MDEETGFGKTEYAEYPLALKTGTVLSCADGDRVLCRYEIREVLGQGGFGVTYLARDCLGNRDVAVKEYFPTDFATRVPGGTELECFSEEKARNFRYGREQFLEEAKTLSRFAGCPNIVRIYSYFETNRTAYFTMDFVPGVSLEQLVTRNGPLPEGTAAGIFFPLMKALETVHAGGVVHRDLAPDNIILDKDGVPTLIDFGAARYSTGEKSCSLDIILKHGYAPIEQYARHGRQGPFTDVYALAATYYYAVTGQTPPDVIDRLQNDPIVPPSAYSANLSPRTDRALMKALSVRAQDRFPTMGAFADALFREQPTAEPAPAPAPIVNATPSTPPAASAASEEPPLPPPVPEETEEEAPAPPTETAKKRKRRPGAWKIVLAVPVLIFFLLSGAVFLKVNEYLHAHRYYDQLASDATVARDNPSGRADNSPLSVDFPLLHRKNGDIKAWICLPGTSISYPVVQGDDNTMYLNCLPDGSESRSGSVMIEYLNRDDFQDTNTVIYGKYMMDGSMFAPLHRYDSQEFFDAHPNFYLLTPEANYLCSVFAGYITSCDSDAYQISFPSGQDFSDYIALAKERSFFSSDVGVWPGNRIVTLSTSTGADENTRFVLQAKLVHIS